MSYSIIKDTYKNETNILIIPHWAFNILYNSLQGLFNTSTKYSGGFPMTEYYLKGVKVEKSYWCDPNRGYFIDRNGKMHRINIDEKKGTFYVSKSLFR